MVPGAVSGMRRRAADGAGIEQCPELSGIEGAAGGQARALHVRDRGDPVVILDRHPAEQPSLPADLPEGGRVLVTVAGA